MISDASPDAQVVDCVIPTITEVLHATQIGIGQVHADLVRDKDMGRRRMPLVDGLFYRSTINDPNRLVLDSVQRKGMKIGREIDTRVVAVRAEQRKQVVGVAKLPWPVIGLNVRFHITRPVAPLPDKEFENVDLGRPGRFGEMPVGVFDAGIEPEYRPHAEPTRQFRAHFDIHARCYLQECP
jgi:hypothetical protein